MKIIIIGTSLSGKTSLIRRLKEKIDLPISEIDEELTKLNNGRYPDEKLKKDLSKKIIQELFEKDNIIFFTNTNYFIREDLAEAKNKGFKIIQINVSLEELFARNKKRVTKEGYEDMGKWLPGMVEYQKEIVNSQLVDQVIDGNKPIDKVFEEILIYFNQ